MRLLDNLLTDIVKGTVAYANYDVAQKNVSVGLTMKKTKTAKGESTGKLVVKSR